MYGQYSFEPEQSPAVEAWERQEARRVFSRVGLSLLVLLAVRELVGMGLRYLLDFLAPSFLREWWMSWVLSFVPMYAFGLPAMLLSLRGVEVAPHNTGYLIRGEEKPKPRFGFGWWIVIVIIALGWMEGGNFIGNGLMYLLSALTGHDYTNVLNTIVERTPLPVVALGTAVLAPIGEELIFRKIIIDRTRRYGDTVAILLSATFFALFHGNLFQFFYAFLLGLLLGYLYTRTGNIAWSMGLHAFVNFYGGVLTTALSRAIDFEQLTSSDPDVVMNYFLAHPLLMSGYYLFAMSIYAFILASIILTICLRRQVKLGRGAVTLKKGKRLSVVLLNVGVIAALVICLAVITVNLLPLPFN